MWDLDEAFRETTATRERVCINGLWRWQPAGAADGSPPPDGWGLFKVPGSWPGINDWMQKDCQTVHPHERWKDQKLGDVRAAWYERTITIPREWSGRRIAIRADALDSFARVFVDGAPAGELRFPGGELDLGKHCRPGRRHRLNVLVVALPLDAVMASYGDSASVKQVKGEVARRGLCGDVFLDGVPSGPRITDVRVAPALRQKALFFECGLADLEPGRSYALRGTIAQDGHVVQSVASPPLTTADLRGGRFAFSAWAKGLRTWDVHTPGNQQTLSLSLTSARGVALDTYFPVQFGYRELWIEGRDFVLNGKRLHLCAIPIDSAGIGAFTATYAAVRETLERMKSFGVNFVYMHNYGCEPGTHLGFDELLRAADDAGMLVGFSLPHFGQYRWEAPDADRSNGYARHVEHYVRVAQNHPSVVAYAMSHNACGYNEDMNPDLIGIRAVRDVWSGKNAERALRAEAIARRIDPSRIVYHHASGDLGSMHAMNFYLNFVPIQELSDWYEHWASAGVKPAFMCEYGVPFSWDFAMYRGWCEGVRTFGSAQVPWEFCLAEWGSQFLGDRAFEMSEQEKANLRWEAKQFREGKRWFRWDYPSVLGSDVFDLQHTVIARYLTDNFRAFRTWGVSGISPWEYGPFWRARPGLERRRRDLDVDWDRLQRPGFSPDYVDQSFEGMPYAFERSDWLPMAEAESLYRNNLPELAYLAGKPARFTSKDHVFTPGETVQKQIVVINDGRESTRCDYEWSVAGHGAAGEGSVHVGPGEQQRVALEIPLAGSTPPGTLEIQLSARFPGKTPQPDAFALHVVARPEPVALRSPVAVFDPGGETARELAELGIPVQPLGEADFARGPSGGILVIGKGALGIDGRAPSLDAVRRGLRVVVFEQTAEALEKRLGLRVHEYGLRQVFPRVADHPIVQGVAAEQLRDWRGEATLVPPRSKYRTDEHQFNGAPTVHWCGIAVTRAWRSGNRGNVASVLIEKPQRGAFMPLLDGGFSLQYSPLLEYREGSGVVVFCQLDVTGRSETEPTARQIVGNLLRYLDGYRPSPVRRARYAGDAAGRQWLERIGVSATAYRGGLLADDDVLVLGPGGGKAVGVGARAERAVRDWVDRGGHLLAIGLDEQELGSLLPFRVTTQNAEHISTTFPSAPLRSLLAGVSPADLVNRDPRDLPLVTGGAVLSGNGVLACASSHDAVLCQIVPWHFDPLAQRNLKRTFRRASFAVSRLLANLGVVATTPLLDRFSRPAAANESRWLDGMYVDRPEEWDDPYRFFRW